MVRCSCGLKAVIRTSWTNRNPGRRFYGRPTLELMQTQREAQQANELFNLTRQSNYGVICEDMLKGAYFGAKTKIFEDCLFLTNTPYPEKRYDTQREAQQENELSNLTRQLLAIVNHRFTIIEELERLSKNLVAYKTREDLKRIQKVDLINVIELKKELRLQ
ncbi:hypothetical protein Tco_0596134, partial [Tanacetum coccineum]